MGRGSGVNDFPGTEGSFEAGEGTPDPKSVEDIADAAREDPSSVRSEIPTLCEYIDDEDSKTRLAADTIARIAKEHPESARSAVPELHQLLHDPDYMTRARALSALFDIAKETPATVRPVVPTLIYRLSEEDDEGEVDMLAIIGGILILIAERYPEAVRPAISDLKTLLEEDSEDVRSVVIDIFHELVNSYPDETEQVALDLAQSDDEAKRVAGNTHGHKYVKTSGTSMRLSAESAASRRSSRVSNRRLPSS